MYFNAVANMSCRCWRFGTSDSKFSLQPIGDFFLVLAADWSPSYAPNPLYYHQISALNFAWPPGTPGLKDRHWAQISAAIGHEIRPEASLAFQVCWLARKCYNLCVWTRVRCDVLIMLFDSCWSSLVSTTTCPPALPSLKLQPRVRLLHQVALLNNLSFFRIFVPS